MMKRNQFLALFIVMSLSLSLVGCAKLERDYPQRNFYILSVGDENQNRSTVSRGVLEVSRFQISPSFSGREFVYRKSDLSYVSDFYNQFFRYPALLITDQATKWFSQRGIFTQVIDPTVDVDTDYTLQGNVSELYGDFRTTGTPKAVLAIQFFFIDDRPINPIIIFQNNYRREVILSSSSPEDLVEGWNEALRQILKALEDDLRKVSYTATSSISSLNTILN